MPDIFIGRQPIFYRDLQVYAYELLFRGGEYDESGVVDGNWATTQVILNTFMEFGLNELVGKHRAFINLTRDFLVRETPLPFPKDRVVLEVLEDVEVDATLIDAVLSLAQEGYTLALDDFRYEEKWEPLLEAADIVKIDVQDLSAEELREHVRMLKQRDVLLLAEKVETREEFTAYQKLGFDLYQGFFFNRPDVLRGSQISANVAMTQRLLARLHDPEVSVGDLENLISQDVSLSYKLLRYINSAFFNLPRAVDSISQAVVYLGLNQIRTWASLIAMSSLEDKPDELLTTALVRARMCQMLAEAEGRKDTEQYFTVGLLSTLDALMDTPMQEVIQSLPLSEEIAQALLGHEGSMGAALGCTLAYESWDPDSKSGETGPPPCSHDIYLKSVAWASNARQDLG